VRTNPKAGNPVSRSPKSGSALPRAPRRRDTQPTSPESPETAASATVSEQSIQEEIARLAYLLWEERGGVGGSPEEDWLRAEQEILARSKA